MDDTTFRLLHIAAANGKNVATRVAADLGVTRQAATARLNKLLGAKLLTRSGRGAGVLYALAFTHQVQQEFERTGLSEDRVWRSLLLPVVEDLAANVRDIWQYGMTEMINNAIDHSGAQRVVVGLRRTALATEGFVSDAGEGIFLRIQKALDLFDPRESILELAKGKFTTDPANHSGEGIFFTSKVFDGFQIQSGRLFFRHDDGETDVLIEEDRDVAGTVVRMVMANDSKRTTREIFDKFAAPEEFTFAKTIVPVRLAQHEGEKLVSRSQAKRLTMRFERFQTVILDFSQVEEIGQGFADEVFRVFKLAHPQTLLAPVQMNDAVAAMVARATAASRNS
jgi:hypothetical protein